MCAGYGMGSELYRVADGIPADTHEGKSAVPVVDPACSRCCRMGCGCGIVDKGQVALPPLTRSQSGVKYMQYLNQYRYLPTHRSGRLVKNYPTAVKSCPDWNRLVSRPSRAAACILPQSLGRYGNQQSHVACTHSCSNSGRETTSGACCIPCHRALIFPDAKHMCSEGSSLPYRLPLKYLVP